MLEVKQHLYPEVQLILAREKEIRYRWRCMPCPTGCVMMHFKLTEKELKNANPGTENLILEMVELGYLQQSQARDGLVNAEQAEA